MFVKISLGASFLPHLIERNLTFISFSNEKGFQNDEQKRSKQWRVIEFKFCEAIVANNNQKLYRQPNDQTIDIEFIYYLTFKMRHPNAMNKMFLFILCE